ncbi:MAG: GAF domain-containing sensor histidine kinase [Chloroflexi bacterium]|nr:GAF domain-containing sensor histidine kinase [Chloroflexota bacterium]
MNPITAFLVQHLIIIQFLSGLVFFALATVVMATSHHRDSDFRFAQALPPLALFSLLQSASIWWQMFGAIENGSSAGVVIAGGQIILLATSFLALLTFGMLLLSPERLSRLQLMTPLLILVVIWLGGVFIADTVLKPDLPSILAITTMLARYGLGIPASLLATWALMRQQRTFREQGLPQFGHYLVWSAAALLLFGTLGQAFAQTTAIIPSNILNAQNFLAWFGIPIELFRGVLIAVFAFFFQKALGSFAAERERRLSEANQAKIAAQQAQLEAERLNRQAMEILNQELRLTTQELTLLLHIANILVSPRPLTERLQQTLHELVASVPVCDHGLILLPTKHPQMPMIVTEGFDVNVGPDLREQAVFLGHQAIAKGVAMCQRINGVILNFDPNNEVERQQCREYPYPMVTLALPLSVQERVIGSLVFAWPFANARKPFSMDEFQLVFTATQQLALSIEHARLNAAVQEREALLEKLLQQIVNAQEAERKRIARDLHDATSQALTAISLGLRGIEAVLQQEGSAVTDQVQELGKMSTEALTELRQIMSDLRPSHLDDLGLTPTVRWCVGNYEKRYGIPVSLELRGQQERLNPERETLLFRIVQEALTNAAKHAHPSHVHVTLAYEPEQIYLAVEDDGVGFDVNSALRRQQKEGGWGLIGMQERASLLGGQMSIHSTVGQGTRIEVSIPRFGGNQHDKEN